MKCLPGLVDQVVLGLEEPEPAAALRQVVQVIRNLPGEVVHLIDERRDEEQCDPDGGAKRHEVDDPRRDPATLDAPLEAVNRGIEGEREEEGDEDPREDVACDPDDLEHDRGGEQDSDDPEHGPRQEVDDAYGAVRHHCSIAIRPDGRLAAR